jgi:hypothetical protein
MRCYLTWLSVASLAFASEAQADVLVAPVAGTNLGSTQVDAISETLAAAYQVNQSEPVVPMHRARQTLSASSDLAAAARQLKASEYVYATATRLDERIVITAARYTLEGRVIQSAKVVATSLDDVEPASDRLVRALLAHPAADHARTLDNVTRTESKAPNRVWSTKLPGFKAGVIAPIGWGDTISPMMTAGFSLRIETQERFLEFGVGLNLPPGRTADSTLAYGGVYADIGVNFYLMHSTTAPYLGLGVMPRLMSHQVTNLAPYGQAGLMFMRESSTRFYTELRVAQNVLPVGFGSSTKYDSATGNYTYSAPKDLYPTELSLAVGIGF